jgi:predicted site-specific integrase-resolvase
MAFLVSSEQVCEMLGITPNNLHQIAYRKQLQWVKKEGKRVYYSVEDVEALKAKRDAKGK